MIFVTGGGGFIGSNFVQHWLNTKKEEVLVIDKLTYADGNENLAHLKDNDLFSFAKIDINDKTSITHLFQRYQPNAILNFAAETHVDKSILNPGIFIDANYLGTYSLLEVAKQYYEKLPKDLQSKFKFIQVSTDEVYGTLDKDADSCSEDAPYSPTNPYSASKSAADHLVKAYYHTYGLPTIVSNCSNNYGPYQFPEKLIPLTILNALQGKEIPIYGNGLNIRDWLYVEDHCSALQAILDGGQPGESYNIGASNELSNIEVVKTICSLLDNYRPHPSLKYESFIKFVKDRPGHDKRYAINSTKLKQTLGWLPSENFETGMNKTIRWYLSNFEWVTKITNTTSYKTWIHKNYMDRERL